MEKKYRRGDIGPDGRYFIQYARHKRVDGSIAVYENWGGIEQLNNYKNANKKYYQKNKEALADYRKKYEKENSEKIAEKRRKYYQKNKERINKRQKKYGKMKYYSNPEFRLASKVRSRVKNYVRKNKISKKEKTHKYLGCTYRFFKDYIESKFTDGMNWERLLRGEIHVDHIRPISSFNLLDENEIKKAFHYTNCQPLWARDNLKKSAKWNPENNDFDSA